MVERFYQRPVSLRDIDELAEMLHPDDIAELRACGAYKEGDKLCDVLDTSVSNSEVTYVIRCVKSHLPMAIGGYTVHGYCWFLSSKALIDLSAPERHEFRQMLMVNLLSTLKLFPKLENMAWSKNKQHLRLIEACGGHLMGEHMLPTGEYFVHFEFLREDYPQLN